MTHITHGIVQDPNVPDRYYFSPARVALTVAHVLADPAVPPQDRAATVAGRLLEQAFAAEGRPCR